MDIPPQQNKSECDIDYCSGVAEEASFPCEVCEAAIHPMRFYAIIRKLPEYPTSCHDEIFCSPVCCTWHGKEGVDMEGIRKEHNALSSVKKKQLI
jgi:hypothetical protein